MSHRLIRPSLAVAAPALAGLLLAGCGGSAPSVSAPSGATATASVPATSAATDSSQDNERSSRAPEPSTESSRPATEEQSSGSDDSSADRQKPTSKGKTFRITTPAGWHDIIGRFGDIQGMQLAIADSLPSGGKLTNINVVTVTSSITDTSSFATGSAKRYRKKGDTVKVLPGRTIAGEAAQGLQKHDKENTQSQTQWFFNHSGKIYIVTLTNSPSTADSAGRTFDTVIGSWTWK